MMPQKKRKKVPRPIFLHQPGNFLDETFLTVQFFLFQKTTEQPEEISFCHK